MTGNRTVCRPLAAILITLALVTGSATANAAEELWECFCSRSIFSSCNSDDVVTLTANRTDRTGVVQLGDISHDTRFYIDGFDRRWDWGFEKGNSLWDQIRGAGAYKYAFAIRTNKEGLYFNFKTSKDGTALPRAKYDCEKR